MKVMQPFVENLLRHHIWFQLSSFTSFTYFFGELASFSHKKVPSPNSKIFLNFVFIFLTHIFYAG